NPAFRRHCTGTFGQGGATLIVGQDEGAELTLTIAGQPAYTLRPYQGRTFVIGEFDQFRVEFRLGPDGGVDELVFHQPNGRFVSRRKEGTGALPKRESPRLAQGSDTGNAAPPLARCHRLRRDRSATSRR